MDEVVRRPVIDKTKLLGHIENELRTYKELGADFDERRHELFGLRSDIMDGKFESEANRLLIEEREQDKAAIERLSNLQLHRMEVEDGAINFHISGEAGMAFASILVRFFEDNGGKNFFSFDMKRGEEHFAINIQKVNGVLSPTEMMNQQAGRIAEQDKELRRLKFVMLDMNGTEVYEGTRCEVYIDGEPPNDGWAKAIVKRESDGCWIFDFYEGVEWDDPKELCCNFSSGYVRVI
ncbi:hypothetical protein OB236_38425 [Paenibacillus sp. WQ 127069]|uniref:DUF3164 family protein n=2 Tax=Paenibacillus baimaensis TaxID=2982185 RepID=A0ABT2UTQ0_9BACL|nr:hypothetical protein [Paenibacillus sp. WQ 127069]